MRLHDTGYAKINLALHVRRRREDGYHELDTIFAFAAEGDGLSAEPAAALSLAIGGPFAEALSGESDNLVLRAARALRGRFGVTAGAALRLDKRLPIASGIGGGSADAAAALRLLCRLWGIDPADARVAAIAAELGADVPACLASRLARAQGLGHPAVPVEPDTLAGMPLLLVNPGAPLSTGAVFRAWDGQDRGALAPGDPLAAALAGRNDLELPAQAALPILADLLARLAAQPGTCLARMSGSGATCFALFRDPSACAAADRAIAAARPDWWRLATVLR